MENITNSEIISKIKELGHVKSGKWLYETVIDSASSSTTNVGHMKSFESLCKKTYSTYRQLLKSKSKECGRAKFESFMSETVNCPVQQSAPRKRDLEKSENLKRLQESTELFKDMAQSLAGENFELKNELSDIQKQHRVKLSAVGNIKKLKESLNQNKTQLEFYKKCNNSIKYRLDVKNSEIKRLRSRLTYETSCKTKIEARVNGLAQKIRQLENEVETLNHEKHEESIRAQQAHDSLNDTLDENNWLRALVNDEIVTYNPDSKMYTPKLVECVFALLNLNVSQNNISPVIESVLSLADCKANRLPCPTTVNNMNFRRLALSQQHLSEEFVGKTNVCLLSDETNKFGVKVQGMHASDPDGRMWVLGLREMTSKAGKEVLQVFKDIILDIDETCQASNNEISKQILKNISSTMSDRAATQLKFNDLLEDFRTTVLKEDLGDAWENMSEEEQSSVSKICNFFCSLHALVHMAETSAKVLTEVEAGFFEEPPVFDSSFRQNGESGTVRLVRTCCKAFARGGDEKSGHHLHFQTFCKEFLTEKNFRSVPLDRFRGNRFNILFQNAGSVFFLKDQLKNYLELDSSNRLLAAVKYDLNVTEYVAGCKALGLVCELVTTPLWCAIEDSSISIMDSQKIYEELVTYLRNLNDNIEAFLTGTYLNSLVDNVKLQNSEIFKCLTTEWEHDGKVEGILRVMIPALCALLERLFADFLSSGAWFDGSEILKNKTKGVPKHNKFSETIFGHMDRLLREKPNTSQIATEANIIFVHNKTLEWLKSKPEKERAVLVKAATNNARKLRKKYKERHAEIETERRRQLAEKLEQKERIRLARLKKKEDLTNDIQLWGLWQSEDEVDSAMSLLKTKKDKMSALKAQLNFRKTVLCQSVKNDTNLKDVFKMSKSNNTGNVVKLTIQDLCINVKKLVHQSFLCSEVQEEQVLLGKKVKHRFNENGKQTWYMGKVISQVPGYPSWYNIKYAGDVAIYTYQLLEDYAIGDLKISL